MSTNGTNGRVSYARMSRGGEMPNLLDVQLESYQAFLQPDVAPDKRKKEGLQEIFLSVFPITDVHENFQLEFVQYQVGRPRYSIVECKERNMTYAAPLKATLRLISKEADGATGGRKVKDVLEQDVFLGELPLIAPRGTFIINGAERVIVSQLHRSPGVFFDEVTHPNGKRLFQGRIIPFRGSWVEFNLDINDVLFVHIDSRRKLPVTTLLRALGISTDEELLAKFYPIEVVDGVSRRWAKVTGRIAAENIIDESSGEVLLAAGDLITEDHVGKLKEYELAKLKVLSVDPGTDALIIPNTLKKDPTKSREEALFKIYSLLRPGEPPSLETAEGLLERLFFNTKRYDLGEVGRYMINQRLGRDVPLDRTVLAPEDFEAIVAYLIRLRNGDGFVDDIDHLGNRRARSVGELLSNLFSVGLSRIARTIRERLSLKDTEAITPHDLVNARTVSAVIDTFFGSSQLSQFMDQTNPLAELTHKRRLSALGPGGLTRERAAFEVRDVHHTHYGRLCPVETPEGPNIGLIASLATFARINRYGFLETPYRRVKNGIVTSDIIYLTADEEDKHQIAQANEPLDDKGRFVNELVRARQRSDFPMLTPTEVDFMDVAPEQLVSVAASLIPFLEHDDANRALMGSNMQRQAVPLLKAESPIVGTGIEGRVARDSGVAVMAEHAGVVEEVDAEQIIIRPKGRAATGELGFEGPDTYVMPKFERSNQDTCLHYKPKVRLGQKVEAGDVIADGPAVEAGELALGANIMVAFMPWRGFNFEDAIIVSERLIQEDIFTSIHIEQFELQVRDTKRGSEEITREIPNVSEEVLLNLDEQGVVRIGAEVEAGDILVGKVTPKGETELSPEERLLRAIFGEKAGDVKDASLKAPPGMKGVVINTRVFSRKERTEQAKKREKQEITGLKRRFGKELDTVRRLRSHRLAELLEGQSALTVRLAEDDSVAIKAGSKYKADTFLLIDPTTIVAPDGWTDDARLNRRVDKVLSEAGELLTRLQEQLNIEIEKVIRGAELPPGVKQLVKVSVAIKRKLAVGDKMAGRHGNKGVVARIVPVEDMPHQEDGTPIDMILNPLGVPSRMNVGQILETHLGWAAWKLGRKVSCPVFDGAHLEEIRTLLVEAGLPSTGKAHLQDGVTGEPFGEPITIGMIYMMKLSHLVDDKIHARSIGPYSLVTQQPLGGKAQFGGQRFGEMEVWALEAYGAAYTLQEMLTVKSDDVTGRSRIYEAIVKGENPPEPGIPESFNVLVKELQALGLDIDLVEKT
ncbi:MAG: DNA-directed RNA polymerase subunit beta [candidate division Zixibacteria bacterium]|nr:DNA-directed RNA polymerase subunit beta [candidate division Zixibacteria bacterium]